MYRRRWGGLAALAAVALLIGVPAQSGATAAPGQLAGTQRVAAAARQAGAGLRLALTGHTRPDVLSDAAPLSVTRDVTGTATVTATATMTATEIATATATLTATATTTPTVTATATPVPTNTATPTRTPRPTHTPTPTPTRTPRPTATPTPRPLSVRLVSVGVYRLVKGHEQRITSASLNTVIRLKIVASVANAAPSGVTVTAIWAIRGLKGKGFYKYQHTYVIKNGSTGLYDDITLPRRFLGVGNYLFAGTLSSHGHVETAATRLKVTGEVIVLKPQHVHYAHLRMTVPPGWTLVFQRDTRGRPATGKDTLIMFSPTRRAAVSIVSVQLDRVPSASDLAAFAPIVMQQEFGTVKNIKTISFKDQIDGHDVFAVQGQVSIGGRASQVISIVTNKARQFYAFSVVNLAKSAPPGEIRDALAAIFGAKLD